jgi:hypothetical protein
MDYIPSKSSGGWHEPIQPEPFCALFPVDPSFDYLHQHDGPAVRYRCRGRIGRGGRFIIDRVPMAHLAIAQRQQAQREEWQVRREKKQQQLLRQKQQHGSGGKVGRTLAADGSAEVGAGGAAGELVAAAAAQTSGAREGSGSTDGMDIDMGNGVGNGVGNDVGNGHRMGNGMGLSSRAKGMVDFDVVGNITLRQTPYDAPVLIKIGPPYVR